MARVSTVQSIMIPKEDYPVIKQDALVVEAINTLSVFFHQKDGTWFGFQSLLVINNKGIPIGILTLRSLLKALKMKAGGEQLTKNRSFSDFYFAHYLDDASITVKEIMRPINMVTVQKDESVFEALLLVVKRRVNSLPVMDKKQLVGIVRTIDLFWSLGELLE
ncbi:putative signal transduction protein with CBS domains [Desulfofarcimen acetoxidans DSM 771]|jgi:CBS domain-containing protein|uniref:Putative signal transduction protein with CBS domains n=1 Tax=Desulfofarcimen acetoxidans (strain ATCC 49208 / DSM 771 / KCTC 5769 / VKM B-1644 / 5575) TaxID=485916 RepID=C8W3D3_DESAS|nr:CBS domain-containing protein [Desulfofarcimen acetoxidans]ACV61900.1 putative signal transduction protein with CBS domains [Desulfofarcimen acetoxidans DSM 771]